MNHFKREKNYSFNYIDDWAYEHHYDIQEYSFDEELEEVGCSFIKVSHKIKMDTYMTFVLVAATNFDYYYKLIYSTEDGPNEYQIQLS